MANRRSLRSMLPTLLIGSALLLFAWQEGPPEISRWYVAAGDVAMQRDDPEEAKRHWDSAQRWDSQNYLLYYHRGLWRLQQEKWEEALADVEHALELNPNFASALQLKNALLPRVGRFDDVIASAAEQIAKQRQAMGSNPSLTERRELAMLLNNRAYAQAVAWSKGKLDDSQLEEAWQTIQEAMQLLGATDAERKSLSNIELLLDTRGFIALLREDFLQALADMEQAVGLAEQAFAAPLQPLIEFDQGAEAHREHLRSQAAVYYQHRGMVYEALGRAGEAQRDFQRAEELGYDPEASLSF